MMVHDLIIKIIFESQLGGIEKMKHSEYNYRSNNRDAMFNRRETRNAIEQPDAYLYHLQCLDSPPCGLYKLKFFDHRSDLTYPHHHQLESSSLHHLKPIDSRFSICRLHVTSPIQDRVLPSPVQACLLRPRPSSWTWHQLAPPLLASESV